MCCNMKTYDNDDKANSMEFAEPTNFIQFALYKGTSTTILTFISLTPPPPHPFLSGQHCLEVYADWPRVGSLS